MKKFLDALDRACARPPLCWALGTFQVIKSVVAVPLRPLTRWHARRREAELLDIALSLTTIGMDRQAVQVVDLADRWGEVAKVGRHRAGR